MGEKTYFDNPWSFLPPLTVMNLVITEVRVENSVSNIMHKIGIKTKHINRT